MLSPDGYPAWDGQTSDDTAGVGGIQANQQTEINADRVG